MIALKDFFDPGVVRSLGRDLRAAHPGFDEKAFVREGLAGLDRLELTARGWHLATVLSRHLPADFPAAARILVGSLGPELDGTDGFGMAPFRYLPHVFYVARYGLDHFEASMAAQYELTKRFSAEYSIRPFLLKHPAATLARLRVWTSDPSVHVRRLVSEGTRPRLPWAPRLVPFQEDPSPVLALLERLKDDPERYVQRSVANSLNDVGKDHPDLAVDVCRRWWKGASPARRWIVEHALRSLVKKGHRGALELLGYAGKPAVRVSRVVLSPRRARLGQVLRFSFELVSTGRRPQDLLVDYLVHFVKADGATRPKAFKLRRVALAPGERVALEGRVSLEELTTRRPRPGLHRIDLVVNGVPKPLARFHVRP